MLSGANDDQLVLEEEETDRGRLEQELVFRRIVLGLLEDHGRMVGLPFQPGLFVRVEGF